MRRRSLAIGQRHRTVLFLVDGRRPLSEVLELAHQAGALTSHFDELVRLGLVELPHESGVTQPGETVPGALSVAAPTHVSANAAVEVEPTVAVLQALTAVMAPDPPHPSEAIATAPAALGSASTALPARQPDAVLAADSVSAPAALVPVEHGRTKHRPAQQPVTAAPTPDVPVQVAAPVAIAPAAEVREVPKVHEVRKGASASHPEVRVGAAALSRVPTRPAAPARAAKRVAQPDITEEMLLSQVRDVLIDTLRPDASSFGGQMLASARRASTPKEMIELVWKIEKHLSRSSHSHDALISLQRARELLNLGNTGVFGDSVPVRHEP